jgi:hypothetical protein
VRRPAAVLALALLGGAQAAPAEELQVEVFADRPRPAADETVRLTYKFSGPGVGGTLRSPSPLPLRNLVLVGGPSTSDEVSFINGIFKRSLSLTYYLKPRGPGSAEIGETTWALGDNTAKAPGYLFEVGPAHGRRTVPADEEDNSMESLIRARPGPGIGGGNLRPESRRETPILEFRATPDKTVAYVGEEVTIHYELISSLELQGLEYVEPPKFPGLWAEDLERPDRPTGVRDKVDGRVVMRFALLKKLVSGLGPGSLTIPPAKVRTTVRSAPDPFSDPFSFLWRPQLVELETKPITLKILPIPGEKPFRGPVGRFELTAKVDRARVNVGEAVTLKVRLSGTGNLRAATDPPNVSIPNVRLYPPTVKSDAGKAGKPATYTEWEYVLVPSAHGEITIPPVSMEIFDPAAKRILTKKTEPIVLVAEGVVAPPPAAPGTTSAAAAAAAATTPAGIMAATDMAKTELPAAADGSAPSSPSKNPVFAAPSAQPSIDLTHGTVTIPLWAVAALPAALLAVGGGAFLAQRRRRVKAAFRDALAPEPGETKERVAARIDRALRLWLTRRHHLPEGASMARVKETLASAGLPEELRSGLQGLLEDVDFLRFAPQLGDYAEKIRDVRERAERLLPKLL